MAGPTQERFGDGVCHSQRIGPSRLDASAYTDPARWEAERSHLFDRVWLVVDRSERLASPRDTLLWERSGQTLLIARQDDGSLAAFHNVCQHRGARIRECSGAIPGGQLVCPWHGFVYDLRGRLVDLPDHGASFAAGDLDGLRAPAVAVEEWAGFIWINYASEEAEPLADYLGEIQEELSWYGLEDWKTWGGDSWEFAANWKTVIDGFNEAWHTPTAHRNSIRGGFRYDETQFTVFDTHSMMVTPLKGIDLDALPRPIDHRAELYTHYLAFPNTIFSVFPNHAQCITISPIDHAHCRLEGWVMSRREAPEGFSDEKWEAFNTGGVDHFRRVTREDIHISTEVGRTMSSYGYRQNLFNEVECRITAFHSVVERFLREGA